jgi:hypothetical protein
MTTAATIAYVCKFKYHMIIVVLLVEKTEVPWKKHLLYHIMLYWVDFGTTLCDKVCQWIAAGRWFSQGTSGFLHQ